MVHLAFIIFRNPVKFACFSYTFLANAVLSVLKRVLLPTFPRYQPLRTDLQRAYLASASIHLPDIVHRLPITGCPEKRARRIGKDWAGYIVPGVRELAEFQTSSSDRNNQCVILYAHGGGYARGEALQYLRYYERWITIGAASGLDVIFLTVEYSEFFRLSLLTIVGRALTRCPQH